MKEVYKAHIQSIPQIRNDMKSQASQLGIPGSELKQLSFIVEELFSRIARHGKISPEDRVEIRLEQSGQELQLDMEWMGPAFNPTSENSHTHVDPLSVDADEMGLTLVRTFSDQIHFEERKGGNLLSIRKRIRSTDI